MLDTADRRSAPRSILITNIQFLLGDKDEHSGALLDISECGAAVITDAKATPGDKAVLYIDRIGRLKGIIVRDFERGFAVAFELSATQRNVIGRRIAAALKGRAYLRLCEERPAVRTRYNIDTTLHISGKATPVPCRLVDLSQTGCYLRMNATPPIGTHVTIGKFAGVIVRHGEDGVAVDFYWDKASLIQHGKVENCA